MSPGFSSVPRRSRRRNGCLRYGAAKARLPPWSRTRRNRPPIAASSCARRSAGAGAHCLSRRRHPAVPASAGGRVLQQVRLCRQHEDVRDDCERRRRVPEWRHMRCAGSHGDGGVLAAPYRVCRPLQRSRGRCVHRQRLRRHVHHGAGDREGGQRRPDRGALREVAGGDGMPILSGEWEKAKAARTSTTWARPAARISTPPVTSGNHRCLEDRERRVRDEGDPRGLFGRGDSSAQIAFSRAMMGADRPRRDRGRRVSGRNSDITAYRDKNNCIWPGKTSRFCGPFRRGAL